MILAHPEYMEAAVAPPGYDPDALAIEAFIALRFAPNREVIALAERAKQEHRSADRIMQSIEVWRPDHHRV